MLTELTHPPSHRLSCDKGATRMVLSVFIAIANGRGVCECARACVCLFLVMCAPVRQTL